MTDGQTGRQTDGNRQTDKQTERQTDGQTGRQPDGNRQTEKQTER